MKRLRETCILTLLVLGYYTVLYKLDARGECASFIQAKCEWFKSVHNILGYQILS